MTTTTKPLERVDPPRLRLLDQAVNNSGHQFNVVAADEHVFIHYQIPKGFQVFAVADRHTAVMVNNFLVAHYAAEDK